MFIKEGFNNKADDFKGEVGMVSVKKRTVSSFCPILSAVSDNCQRKKGTFK